MDNKIIIDEMGRLFEEFGVNPIVGRIFGVLLSSESPKSLNEISEILSLSKAAISIQIRVLENMGYCQKLPNSKNRQHFYVLKDNYLKVVYRKRLERGKLFVEELKALNDKEEDFPDFINDRIKELIDFNKFMVDEQYKILSTWEDSK